jgi:hypothetical protein
MTANNFFFCTFPKRKLFFYQMPRPSHFCSIRPRRRMVWESSSGFISLWEKFSKGCWLPLSLGKSIGLNFCVADSRSFCWESCIPFSLSPLWKTVFVSTKRPNQRAHPTGLWRHPLVWFLGIFSFDSLLPSSSACRSTLWGPEVKFELPSVLETVVLPHLNENQFA